MKMRGVFLVLAVLLASYSFACAQEQLVLTTYYPSPAGVYSELQLFPTAATGNCAVANDEGKMYYDSGTHSLRVCQDVSGVFSWQEVSTGAGYWDFSARGKGEQLYTHDTAWSVGIGTMAPSGRLQVAGDEVRIGAGGTPTLATDDGDLYVDDDLEVNDTIAVNIANITNGNITNGNIANASMGVISRLGTWNWFAVEGNGAITKVAVVCFLSEVLFHDDGDDDDTINRCHIGRSNQTGAYYDFTLTVISKSGSSDAPLSRCTMLCLQDHV